METSGNGRQGTVDFRVVKRVFVPPPFFVCFFFVSSSGFRSRHPPRDVYVRVLSSSSLIFFFLSQLDVSLDRLELLIKVLLTRSLCPETRPEIVLVLPDTKPETGTGPPELVSSGTTLGCRSIVHGWRPLRRPVEVPTTRSLIRRSGETVEPSHSCGLKVEGGKGDRKR